MVSYGACHSSSAMPLVHFRPWVHRGNPVIYLIHHVLNTKYTIYKHVQVMKDQHSHIRVDHGPAHGTGVNNARTKGQEPNADPVLSRRSGATNSTLGHLVTQQRW